MRAAGQIGATRIIPVSSTTAAILAVPFDGGVRFIEGLRCSVGNGCQRYKFEVLALRDPIAVNNRALFLTIVCHFVLRQQVHSAPAIALKITLTPFPSANHRVITARGGA
jgi:hypothetical protein